MFCHNNSHLKYTILGKNKKIGLKPSLTKKEQQLCNFTEKIETDKNYCDDIKFCCFDFNSNIKIGLHELNQGKKVHTIPSFSKVETLINKITDTENQVRNIAFLLLLIIL